MPGHKLSTGAEQNSRWKWATLGQSREEAEERRLACHLEEGTTIRRREIKEGAACLIGPHSPLY